MSKAKYIAAAPLLSKGVTVTRFKTDHPKVPEPEPVEDTEPTAAQVKAVYKALLTMEERGVGHSGVARETRVKIHWVKRIHDEMLGAFGPAHEA